MSADLSAALGVAPADGAGAFVPAAPRPPEDTDAPTALVWPLRHAIALVVAVAGLALVAGRVLRAMPKSGLASESISLVILGTFLLVYAVEIGIVALVARRAGASFHESVGMRGVPRMGKWLAAAAASGLGLRIAVTVYSGFMFSMGWRLRGWDSNLVKYFPSDALGASVMFFIIAMAAPFVEETIFRGVLLPSLVGRFGCRGGVAIAVVVFSAIHVNLFSFAPILLVGWVLAALFLRTRSLWVAIACHSVFNGIGIVTLLLLRGIGIV